MVESHWITGSPSSRLERKQTINSWKCHALCDMVLSYKSNRWEFQHIVRNNTQAPAVRWPSCTITVRKALSYVCWKPRNGQLAKMGSFHQSKRSDNKWYAVKVRWGIFIENLTYYFIPKSGRKYSHTNSYNSAMTIIVQDDHLTAGAWATCGKNKLKRQKSPEITAYTQDVNKCYWFTCKMFIFGNIHLWKSTIYRSPYYSL